MSAHPKPSEILVQSYSSWQTLCQTPKNCTIFCSPRTTSTLEPLTTFALSAERRERSARGLVGGVKRLRGGVLLIFQESKGSQTAADGVAQGKQTRHCVGMVSGIG
ncbi:hypothetical protein BSKO_09935 [Bryopsis sp. KO-2023]|nr:hypothetical protein BSKO_09935 [Bryopsis sp. KO-2023]